MKEASEIIAKEILRPKWFLYVKIAISGAVIGVSIVGGLFLLKQSFRNDVYEIVTTEIQRNTTIEAKKDSFIFSILEKHDSTQNIMLGLGKELREKEKEIFRLQKKLASKELQQVKKNEIQSLNFSSPYQQELSFESKSVLTSN